MNNSKALSARERIENLLDEKSFIEIGAAVHARNTDFNMAGQNTASDGVITGYGTINGNLVYVYSQDASVMGGSIGEMHARKIDRMYDLAMKMGAPIIGMIDCSGIRLQEATDALDGIGRLYMKQTMASGVIPQYTAVFGQCGGSMAIMTALSDITLMMKDNASLFVNSPNALEGNIVTKLDTSASDFQSKVSGNADLVFETEEALLTALKDLVCIMPQNLEDESIYCVECRDDLNRHTNDISVIGDAGYALELIADRHVVYELKPDHAPEMVTALMQIAGYTVGVVANRTEKLDAEGEIAATYEPVLSAKGMKKAAKFVKLCDAFNIPVVTLVNVKGFEATVEAEAENAQAAAEMIGAFANATTPKLSIVSGEAYGSAYLAMNAPHIGADLVYAYPSAKIGMMDAKAAVKIMYQDEICSSEDPAALLSEKTAAYESIQSSPEAAAGRGYVDAVIEPEMTRQYIAAGIDMLSTKRESRPDKKHGTM